MSWSLLIAVMAGSTGSTDLVSAIDAQAYFKLREIEVKPEKMLELAARTPTGGKEEIAQLLAIRWLGEHPAAVQKTKNARAILQQIADGTKGKDKQGFAVDYARMALARLDGKALALVNLPANSVRTEGLEWFPKGSTIFGGLDLRPPKGVTAEPTDVIRRLLAKEMDEQKRGEMYAFAENIGNVRIDRASFAVIPDMKQDEQTRLYIRVTGKGNAKRIADFIAREMRGAKLKNQKGPGGEAITRIDLKGPEPAFAFVGDTDLLMCGFPGGRRGQAESGTVLDEALQVLSGKQASILKGPYAKTLKDGKSRLNGLLIGDLPERWTKEMTRGRGNPFRAFPQHFHVTLTRAAKALRIRFTGSATNAKDAKAFVDGVQTLKQQASDGLSKLPEFAKVDKKTIESLQGALKSIKIEAQDALLTGSATISNAAAKAGMEMMLFVLFPSGGKSRPVEKR